ncbi:hypothetical protein [Streptomyces shenzhenensis]|uniref:hypothetical protein n=1 Tax=Streptomyces shenzhenensis TaxID=943815 RepID=UPI00287B6185|nr:hypothetical protein [Streptomyces shenzhenensis]
MIQLLYAAGSTSKGILHLRPFIDTLLATTEMPQRLADERDRIQIRIDDMVRTRDRLDELIALAADSAASFAGVDVPRTVRRRVSVQAYPKRRHLR